MSPVSKLAFVRGQGFLDAEAPACTSQYGALMFQPRAIGILFLIGVALQRGEEPETLVSASTDLSLAVWDLVGGQLVNDLELDRTPEQVEFSAAADRVIVAGDDWLTLWDARRSEPIAEHSSRSGYIFPPAMSIDGRFVAIAEESPFVRPTFSLLSVEDGRVLSTIDGVADLRDWLLGPKAAYLAVLTPARQVEVLDPMTGEQRVLLQHPREIERIIGVDDAAVLVTVDTAGDIQLWRLPASTDGTATGTLVGTAIDASSVSVAENSAAIAYEGFDPRLELHHHLVCLHCNDFIDFDEQWQDYVMANDLEIGV